MIWHNTPTISKNSLYTAGPQKFLITLFSLILVFLQACNSTKDYYKLPTKASETTFNDVIEIPSGTNKKYEYDPSQKSLWLIRKTVLIELSTFCLIRAIMVYSFYPF